ncbi:hypothetical protein CSO01_25340 [Cellulomonas soli]|uniref:Uncharacterized protein n=1 Tax=Cellulomonas soli TaxID=931535 RepID=A0A512PF44_9CELL|nr:hypothetical protein CSO01_25340 [Cellulomonas soli]
MTPTERLREGSWRLALLGTLGLVVGVLSGYWPSALASVALLLAWVAVRWATRPDPSQDARQRGRRELVGSLVVIALLVAGAVCLRAFRG